MCAVEHSLHSHEGGREGREEGTVRQTHSKPPFILTFLLDLGIAQCVPVQDSGLILCDWGSSSGSESLGHSSCGVVCLGGRERGKDLVWRLKGLQPY